MLLPTSSSARTLARARQRRRLGAGCMTALGLAVLVAASGCTGDFSGKEAPSAAVPEEQRPLFLPAGEPVNASPSPPAIQGGTLLVLRDGVTAVAADPDRDRVFVADLVHKSLSHSIPLQPGDEPGRAVEDVRGDVHLLLRRGGAVLRFSPVTGEVISRTQVCAAPSGVAYQQDGDLLQVVCRTGEWVTVSALTGQMTNHPQVARDMRDVVVAGDGSLLVSLFRHSEVLVIDKDGDIVRRVTPATGRRALHADVMRPRVAWRMTSAPDGAVLLLHQRATDGLVGESEGAYLPQLGCDGIVQTTVSEIDPSGGEQPATTPLAATLATDLAVSPDGSQVAIAITGHSFERGGFLPEVLVLPRQRAYRQRGCAPDAEPHFFAGEVTAVGFAGNGELLVQSRQPAALMFADGRRINLSEDSRRDTALALFHLDPGTGVSCASCHPAGREDGHVWHFQHSGPRRTPSLAGTLANTAPYHWSGDMTDLNHLFSEVFEGRMLAAPIGQAQRDVFANWLLALPRPARKKERDATAVHRGKALFHDPKVACASCHSGPRFSNNTTVDVGSGGPFQVPSLLGLAARAPYMHYGCAPTLRDRFSPCGGFAHGQVDHLSDTQLTDLIAYLETL